MYGSKRWNLHILQINDFDIAFQVWKIAKELCIIFIALSKHYT